ncbi:TetR/AcrR family transcriptional regulator [Nocardia sp. alder85J]|uniref:TetR/AcrR family transcriptional regulator n=1 Tax=Nocardia sp. alder85J TaxID=2862949 RepID=UPI001CD2FA56|nr:TetR/AcrR family transcriptional regulator [Nocardia sp. alder85J]MCX4093751.1 helix-turn-helix domain containing protein [Nocardia sp. alder85J]
MADRLRADARSNRDQILAAAQLIFREHGVDVPMKTIADQAGVGVGTLYRRFPDRAALISAAAHAYLTGLADLAATAQREEAGAWPTLCRILRECAELRLGAMASALEPGLHGDIRNDATLAAPRARIANLIVALTEQAHADGDLRPEVTADDVASLMTIQVYVLPEQSYAETVQRVMTIALNGMRAG